MTLIDRVGDFQLRNFEECSYAPLARALPLMLHEEQIHIAIGVNGVRRAFKEYFKGVQPARTTVEAAAPRQGVNVEIDAIAWIPRFSRARGGGILRAAPADGRRREVRTCP